MSLVEVRNILECHGKDLKANLSPKKVLRLLSHDLGHLAHEYQSLEYLTIRNKIGFLQSLISSYFEREVRLKAMGKITKYETLPVIKKMLKAEFGSLRVEHFDDDYVLRYDRFKRDFTTYKNIEAIKSEDYSTKLTDAVLTVLTEASAEVTKDISSKLEAFFRDILKDLKEPPTKTLNAKLDDFISRLHFTVYGWPK